MDSNSQSFPSEGAGTKAAFRQPSSDAANRRYCCRSPASGSSSSDESPNRGRSSSPSSLRDDPAKVFDDLRRTDGRRDLDRDYSRSHYGRNGDSYKYEQQSSRSSHSQRSYDDYIRWDKHADKGISKSSSHSGRELRGGTHSDKPRRDIECTRSKDLLHNVDKYAQETSSLDYTKYKDKDSLSDRPGYGRRTMSNTEEVKSEDRDKHKEDRDHRDEKRNYRRSLGDCRTDRSPIYEASRGHQNDSSRRESSGRLIEAYGSDPKEPEIKYTKEEMKKYDDRETYKHKDQYNREDQKAFTREDQESPTKKPKLSRSDKGTDLGKVSKFSTVADDMQSFKQGQELVGKASSEQDYVKESDIDAAKVAAMKAAELVNRNLVGTGYTSTDQKKKLLWGSKKNTVAKEPAHRWDVPLFSDHERQEKFNKLMGLKGDPKSMDHKPGNPEGSRLLQAEKQKELQLDLEKQYTAGLRRRDGRTVGLGL